MTTTKKTTTRRTAKPRKATPKADPSESLTRQFNELRMPTFRDQFLPMAARAEAQQMNHLNYLSELTTLECEVRRQERIKRLMSRSKLPAGKTWNSFDLTRLPMNARRQLEMLRDGTFLDRRENILLFGKCGPTCYLVWGPRSAMAAATRFRPSRFEPLSSELVPLISVLDQPPARSTSVSLV